MFKKLSLLMALMSCGNAYTLASELEENDISVNGNITLVSQYISRGLTTNPENEEAALQATLSVGYDNFYAAYWLSPIGYSLREIQGGPSHSSDKFEHNFIVGYAWDYNNVSYDLWNATYYYQGSTDTTANEIGLTITKALSDKGAVSGSISNFLNDTYFTHQGDTFASVTYRHQFNDKTNLSFSIAGAYNDNSGKYEGISINTQKEFVYRYSTLRAEHSLSDHLTLSAQYYFGGYDRTNTKQENKPVFGLTYSF